MASDHASAPRVAPWALLDTICALARPVLAISALTSTTGIFASTTFCTAATLSSAPAGSRRIPATLSLIAVSISWFWVSGSFSFAETVVL